MSIYILHQHPEDQSGQDFICLSDGFNWFAALLPPIWALSHGLWRIFAVMVVSMAALVAVKFVFDFPLWAIYGLSVWWLGLEANHLHSRFLFATGWGEGINIIAADALMAQRDFFERQSETANGSAI